MAAPANWLKSHQLWIDIAQPCHTYGDELRARLTFKVLRPVFVQTLVVKFKGTFGYAVKSALSETETTLFEHSLTLVESGKSLDIGKNVWNVKFFWPQRDEVMLVANYEPMRSPPYCSYRYWLSGDVEFIDSTSYKGSMSTVRAPTFISSRIRATRPDFQLHSSSLEPVFKVGRRSLSITKFLSSGDEEKLLTVSLNLPSFVVTKSPAPIYIVIKSSDPSQPPVYTNIRLLKFAIELVSKLDLEIPTESASAATQKMTIDFSNEFGHKRQKLVSYSTVNAYEAPALSLDTPIKLTSLLGIAVPHIRASFSGEMATFSYTVKARAEILFDRRTLVAQWNDIPIDVLPYHLQTALGNSERQPMFNYEAPDDVLPSYSRNERVRHGSMAYSRLPEYVPSPGTISRVTTV